MSEKSNDFEIPDDLIIVQLEGENVKRLYAAAISPTDEVTKIGGWNENGKSSLIDCAQYTLCGGRLLPAEPLRRGAKKGHSAVRIESRSNAEFGLKAERRYTKKGDVLGVMLDGQDEPIKSPQELLNRLYNANAAQPDQFLDFDAKKKLTVLQKVVGIDFTDLNAKYAALSDERKGVRREADLLEGQVAGTEKYDDAPKEPIDVSDLRTQLDQAAEHNKAVEQQERERERSIMHVENLLNQARQCDAEVESLRKRAIELKEKAANLRTEASTLTFPDAEVIEPVDASAIISQLQEAEEVNQKVRANEQRRELEKQMRGKNSEVTKLTLALERIIEEKEKQLAEAKFPVPGLSFSDDGVLLNGIPFEQASQEQQVITAAAIALAQQPKLRAILMRRGSLLDPKHQAALRVWARENKCQVFLEVVNKDDDCEVIIQDGYVEYEKPREAKSE